MEKTVLKCLPQSPGVYIFKSSQKPVYIGKALNLKRRVSSYFDLQLEPKTRRMISQADSLKFIIVASELEALLLEAKLINLHKPKYNSVAKDDKHPLYITISKDEFPRIITTRRSGSFGPFPSSKTIYSVLRMIRRIFPYSDHKIGKRPCLYNQIGLCNPCPSLIKTQTDREKYLNNIKNIKALLSGRIKHIHTNLEKDMKLLSKQKKFEEAGLIRDQLQKLEYITQPIIPAEFYLENPNLIEDLRSKELKNLRTLLINCKLPIANLHRIECYDISHLSGLYPAASMAVFVNGEAEKSEYRHFRIRQAKAQSDYDSMREIAVRRLRQPWPKPDLIIVDGGVPQIKAFRVPFLVIGVAKNPDRLIIGAKKIRISGPAGRLVQRMRNEAHRFAQRYHHKLIARNLIE